MAQKKEKRGGTRKKARDYKKTHEQDKAKRTPSTTKPPRETVNERRERIEQLRNKINQDRKDRMASVRKEMIGPKPAGDNEHNKARKFPHQQPDKQPEEEEKSQGETTAPPQILPYHGPLEQVLTPDQQIAANNGIAAQYPHDLSIGADIAKRMEAENQHPHDLSIADIEEKIKAEKSKVKPEQEGGNTPKQKEENTPKKAKTSKKKKKEPKKTKNEQPQSQTSNPDGLHIVFSADCSMFTQWQSAVFLYHAIQTQGHIPITMLVSGESKKSCSKKMDIQGLHSGYPSLRIVYTPDYRKGPYDDDDWRFYNKPAAITYWLKHNKVNEPIIVMLDFDMILVRRLDLTQMQQENGWERPVGKGVPAAQRALFYTDEWLHLPQCTKDPKCQRLQENPKFAEKYYTPGTPYFMHQSDLLKMCDTWFMLAYEVRKWKKDAGKTLGNNDEMFGYVLSAVKLDLAHEESRNLAFSATKEPARQFEGWDDMIAGSVKPYLFHYSQYYKTRHWDENGQHKQPKIMDRKPTTLQGQMQGILRFVKYDWGFKGEEKVNAHEVGFLDCDKKELIDPRTGTTKCKSQNCETLAKSHADTNAYGQATITAYRGLESQEPDFQELFMANTMIANINAAVLDWQFRHCNAEK